MNERSDMSYAAKPVIQSPGFGTIVGYQPDLVTKEEQPISLVRKLSETFKTEGIAYCQWKGTASMAKLIKGCDDIDLLVSRTHGQHFTEIIHRLGFKEARPSPAMRLPGILNYYGYDKSTGGLIHLHAHYRLVIGDSMTMNYHLPVESAILASAMDGRYFKRPLPEYEFIIFVIRMILRYLPPDRALNRQRFLSTERRQELSALRAKVDRTRMFDILKHDFPYIDRKFFDSYLKSLQPGCPLWPRIKAAHRLQGDLKSCARRPLGPDVCLKLWRRGVKSWRQRVSKRKPKKRLAGGGAIIAIVGGDGAGKSTAVSGLHAWLSREFETRKLHLGKPDWSRTTVVLRAILKIGKVLGLSRYVKLSSIRYPVDHVPVVFPGYSLLFRVISRARDRNLAYLKARRFAAQGGLVICDRYPLSQIGMDGPQIEYLTRKKKPNRLIGFLIRRENSYYKAIARPELLIVLCVNTELALRRRSEEDATAVRARNKEIWKVNWHATGAYVIDAGRTREEVLSVLRSLVWSKL